ncbi:SIMPL domain-containing protein [Nocardioides guangzhouensis]|uniref:SIMPL domain-containing protein n=1 Tax=Nocardioides guangzhouensis TaxID=2497878 RepID=A0A4Q4ZAM2_9ACTN|nr:SIMPL domain-containing protein [Nocardioides guangzhouensis]RYP84953.1 SIMPL domain-containing protein [Nocardioides guangzhouensis]
MERVEITVRGEHTAFLRPERATVHAEVGLEGPTAVSVYDGAVASARRVTDAVTALHDPQAGPVTWWSSDQIRTWARRPWNQEGKQLPLVHHAQLVLEVKFRDFARMSSWLGEVTPVPGFRVGRIAWALTAARQETVTREVRTAAVRQAAEKAQAYANALELGRVHPVALADAGMLGQGLEPRSEGPAMFSRAAATAGDDVEFVPQDVAVVARVDARFALS